MLDTDDTEIIEQVTESMWYNFEQIRAGEMYQAVTDIMRTPSNGLDEETSFYVGAMVDHEGASEITLSLNADEFERILMPVLERNGTGKMLNNLLRQGTDRGKSENGRS